MVAMMSITHHDGLLTSQHGENILYLRQPLPNVACNTIISSPYISNLCVCLQSDASAAKMKELAIEMKITPSPLPKSASEIVSWSHPSIPPNQLYSYYLLFSLNVCSSPIIRFSQTIQEKRLFSYVHSLTLIHMLIPPSFSLFMYFFPNTINIPLGLIFHIRSFDSSEWKNLIALTSLPYVLKMLMGLCFCQSTTQTALLPVIGQLSLLEQIASDQHIGIFLRICWRLWWRVVNAGKTYESVSIGWVKWIGKLLQNVWEIQPSL